MEPDYYIERTYKEFKQFLEDLTASGISQVQIGEAYGINSGHISKMLNWDDYRPAKWLRDKCYIRIRKRDERVIIYRGSDMAEKAAELEELTNGYYTITRR